MDEDNSELHAKNYNENTQQHSRLHRLDDINISEFAPELLDLLIADMKLTTDTLELRRRFQENVP